MGKISLELLDFFNNEEISAKVWLDKYALSGEKTPKDMFKRHVKEFVEIAKQYKKFDDSNFPQLSAEGKYIFGAIFQDDKKLEQWLTDMLNFDNIIFGGSAMQGIGNHGIYSTLSNCYVIESPYDSYAGINKVAGEICEIAKRRGGDGFDVSTIRPKYAQIHNQASYSDGPCLFIKGFSSKSREVAQNGRRGALMITLDITHPDSLEFILSKQDLSEITGANLSVKINDKFMEAVANDDDYVLCFPVGFKPALDISELPYNELVRDLTANKGNEKAVYVKRIKAKEYWNILCEAAHKTAEPGVLFTGNWEKYGPDWAYEQYRPVSTNPCFSANTPVLTDTGYHNIIDLVGKKINVWNGNNWSGVEPKITGENQEMLKITLSNGSILECTLYHNWPIWEGFSRGGYGKTVEAKNLKIGDKIQKFNLPVVEFGESLDLDFAYSQGFYCGDGTTSRNSTRLYGEKIKLAKHLLGELANIGIKENHYGTEYVNFVFSEKMFAKDFVPLNYSIKTRLAWLSGYIDADGTIDEVGGCQIVSTNKKIINNVRLMLETLGVQANINDCHSEGIKSLPDQKGGKVDVYCKATQRILIRSLDVQKLCGLGLTTYRCDFTRFYPKRDASRFITIKNIESIPNAEKVYCFNEPSNHKAIFNGILIGQCSEIPMQPYDSCRLVSGNLFELVLNPFQTNSSIDYKKLYWLFYSQLIIADMLVNLDATYVERIINKIMSGEDPIELKHQEVKLWQKIYETSLAGRRIGCGFTALGDMMAALGLPYNHLETINKTFHTKMKAELNATIDLSILFGPFKGWNKNTDKTSIYWMVNRSHFPEEFEKMQRFGRRNVSWSTSAPTGSVSIMTQTTSGVEPLFKAFYKRRVKCTKESDIVDFIDPADGERYTEYFIMHPKFKMWYELNWYKIDAKLFENKHEIDRLDENTLNLLFEKSPWFGNTADELMYKSRIDVLTVVQSFTTHAISATINLPESTDVDIINHLYFEAWKNGLKGLSVYRENSRSGIQVTGNNNKSSELVFVSDENIKLKRPDKITGHYYTLNANGKIYSVIVGLYPTTPYEVFIVSGLDNLPQIIEELEYHVKGEIIKEDKNLYHFSSETFFLKDISDIEEPNEKLISLMLSGLFTSKLSIKKIIKILDKSQPIAGSFTHKLIKILSKYIVKDDVMEICDECGGEIIHENGCYICKSCGNTKC